MIKKFKAIMGRIEEVEVVRETAKQVVVNGSFGEERRVKESDWCSYHDTYEQAKQWIVNKEQERVNKAEIKLKCAQEELEKAKAL